MNLELDYIEQMIELGKIPPCPKCGGEMESWHSFAVYGETCIKCGWTSCGENEV